MDRSGRNLAEVIRGVDGRDAVNLCRVKSHFRFLPSACNCGAREPLTYSGKLRLRAFSATLDGNWTYAPARPLALAALRAAELLGVQRCSDCVQRQERGPGRFEGLRLGIGSTYYYSSSSASSSMISHVKSRFLCDEANGISLYASACSPRLSAERIDPRRRWTKE